MLKKFFDPKLSKKELGALITIAFFALVGFIDSFLILLKEIESKSNPAVLESCNINSVINCGPVLDSVYSKFFGIPVSLIGVVFDEAVLIMAIVILFGFSLKVWQKWIVSLIIAFSIFFSYYLLYMSYFAIGVFCPYCLVSAVAVTFMTIGWFLYLFANFKKIKTTKL